MTKESLEGADWLNLDNYLPVLAPDLFEVVLNERKTITDELSVEDTILHIELFARWMVRYAGSPNLNDSKADRLDSNQLINPKTGQSFTIEDVGFDRQKAVGSTSGFDGREQAVAELTVAIYRNLYPEN